MAHNNPSRRPLTINFEMYTDGDQSFKVELIGLMIVNLKELQASLDASPEIFGDVSHKVKSTVGIINSNELTDLIRDLKDPGTSPDQKPVKSILLYQLCEDLIRKLEEEKRSGNQ